MLKKAGFEVPLKPIVCLLVLATLVLLAIPASAVPLGKPIKYGPVTISVSNSFLSVPTADRSQQTLHVQVSVKATASKLFAFGAKYQVSTPNIALYCTGKSIEQIFFAESTYDAGMKLIKGQVVIGEMVYDFPPTCTKPYVTATLVISLGTLPPLSPRWKIKV